ncbi:Molybdopterin-binding domain of aldehyde dehydrogenase-domain-containing protein [Endogone sp. FLAS-F59071]|nr:Molybdopterin-binding domain of aldehyde dehydrogenase-domain-containing protein [Endogone sp. FLAS-F59071]|eukprot:RUS19542.1 Molybdopterin-binding domain of aldehyde dehydrogenase-domain-containing protein [Endogone sp. FLAS-F59071]
MEYSNELSFFLNGTKVVLNNPDPDVTLLQYVRSVGLTGSKMGCGQGACGACTVVISSLDRTTRKISYSTATSCLLPLCTLDGRHVITIEGVGSADHPHAIQERIALGHGSQCGFCTPGFVMSLYGLLRSKHGEGQTQITEKEIEAAFDGNLCRCTGYRPILDAAKTFVSCPPGDHNHIDSSTASASQPNGINVTTGCGLPDCCQLQNGSDPDAGPELLFPKIQFKKYDPTQELIFPPFLASNKYTPQPLLFESARTRVKWYRPVSLEQMVELKTTIPSARLCAGNTTRGLEDFEVEGGERRYTRERDETVVYVGDVPELKVVKLEDDGLTIGAAITISEFQAALVKAVATFDASRAEPYRAFLKAISYYASPQIRNIATVGGTVALAPGFSDLNPLLIAASARLTVISALTKSSRVVPVRDFFTAISMEEVAVASAVGRTILAPGDIIVSIHIPAPAPPAGHRVFVRWYKQSKRRVAALALVNIAFSVTVSTSTFMVTNAEVALGGERVASTSVRAYNVAEGLVGKTWGDKTALEKMVDGVREEVKRFAGQKEDFAREAAAGYVVKFWDDVGQELGIAKSLEENEVPALKEIERAPVKGTQDVLHHENKVIGKPLPHLTALNQATGEAIYVDDMPRAERESYGYMVTSQRPHANIISIDSAPALALPGVLTFVSTEDIPGVKEVVVMGVPEPHFAIGKVHAVGQYVGMVIAESKELAEEAAGLVKIEYEDLEAILTIEDAIAKQSFLLKPFTLSRGEVHIGGQDHFYLETHSARVVPRGESHEYDLYVSSQNMTGMQEAMAQALAIPMHKIRGHVKRMGGGFGGKEMRVVPLVVACAVAATKLKRPVRCMYDRKTDMITTGGRHPFYAKWKVGVKEDGKIHALDVQLFSNGGWSMDVSLLVMILALHQLDNTYGFPNIRAVGYVCHTNLPSNTAMRGFGSPQGMLIAESFMHEVSRRLEIPIDVLQERNFYREGETSLGGLPLQDFHAPACYKQVKEQAEYARRRAAVDEFNARNKWRKRGLAILPTKHPLGFGGDIAMNQASAVVHMYQDGSVLLFHGGTEMGQGINTKCVQIASEILQIPITSIFISETTTDQVPNPTTNGGSMGSDLNGAAVKLACEILAERLQPIRESMPEASMDKVRLGEIVVEVDEVEVYVKRVLGIPWYANTTQIAAAAYGKRVNLTANGFYRTPTMEWNEKAFCYFSYGAAVTEIELDVLSGDWTILRSDIVMDIGKVLNPALDVGQIEGAFIQGVGYTTLEDVIFSSKTGELQTTGPNSYKIPGAKDIPQIFNVSLVKGVTYEHLLTINRSKGVGEPPLFLELFPHRLPFAIQVAGVGRRYQARVHPRTRRREAILLTSVESIKYTYFVWYHGYQ